VNITTRENELNKMPSPNSRMNTPVSIGFLIWAYGPVETILGGGLKGTGVPFTLRKYKTDHSIKNIPIARIGQARMIFHSLGKSLGNPKNLSSRRETIINSVIMAKKKTAPKGVSIFRILRVPVAAL
jgi:hypothetical protein